MKPPHTPRSRGGFGLHPSPGATRQLPAQDLPPSGNRLLIALSRGERRLLNDALVPVELSSGDELQRPDEETLNLILPDSGLVSLMMEMQDGARTEVGLVGREGIVGLWALLGEPRSPFRAVVRVPGQGRRVDVATLRSLSAGSSNFRDLVRREAMRAWHHAAAVALCNSAHPLDRRAASWLLAARQRVGAGFPLTQEALATSLGARRPTVNAILSMFRQAGLVRYARGRIAIADPAGLERLACSCRQAFLPRAGQPEAEPPMRDSETPGR